MLLSPTIPKMENNLHVRLCGYSSVDTFNHHYRSLHMARGLLHPLEEEKICLVFNSIWNIKIYQPRKTFSGWKCLYDLTETCHKQLQKYLRPHDHIGLNSISMILCSQSPHSLPPWSKLLARLDHAQNVKEQLWMHGRKWGGGGGYVISQWCVTSSKTTEATLNKFCFSFQR